MAESVVRSAHACGFERKSGEKERGGEKGEENWLVGPVHGKERKGKTVSGYEKKYPLVE